MRLQLLASGACAVVAFYDRHERCQAMDLVNGSQVTQLEARFAHKWIYELMPSRGIPKAAREAGDDIWRFRVWTDERLHLYVFANELPVESGVVNALVIAGADLIDPQGRRPTRGLEAARDLRQRVYAAVVIGDIEIDPRTEPIGGVRYVN